MKTTLFRPTSGFLSTSLGLSLMIGVAGCSPESTSPSGGGTPQAASEPADEEHVDHESSEADDQSAMEKMTAALADFSPEDRQSAIKQHFCPVSDEMLGTMGAPLKIDVKGQSVWICCDGCEDKLVAEPDKYLAKLD